MHPCAQCGVPTANKYCKIQCYWKSKKGKTHYNKGKKGLQGANKGSFHAGQKTWNKGLKGYKAGEANGKWLGDKVGYGGKHDRLTKKYGRPKSCEFCGKVGSKQKCAVASFSRWTIEWAKKTASEYTDKIEDYHQLCRKCHALYDRWW